MQGKLALGAMARLDGGRRRGLLVRLSLLVRIARLRSQDARVGLRLQVAVRPVVLDRLDLGALGNIGFGRLGSCRRAGAGQ